VLGDDELDRAGIVATGRRRVQRKRAAQHHRAVFSADRDRDELAGPGRHRDSRRDHRELQVITHPLQREDLG